MRRRMKNSHLKWIEEIPDNWQMMRIKNIILAGKDGIKIGPFGSALTNKTSSDGIYNVYSQANIISKDFSTTKNTIDENVFEKLAGYEVYPGDICLSMMGTIGKCRQVPSSIKRGIMDSHLIKIRLKDSIDSRFFEYTYDKDLGGICFAQMQLDKKGFIMDGLNTSIVKNLFFPVPDIQEQRRISDYLDKKTAQIDAIIEKTRASIEEYKKLKQAIITQAVTKGVRGERKMKDSGIAWIGEIPEEWITPKTLQCLEMPITDGPHTTPELYDEGIPFVSAEAVSTGNGRINFDHIRGYISKDFYEECCKKYIPQVDDVYMIKSGATTGRVAIVDTDKIFTIWSPLAVFRANREILLPLFLYYCLQADYVQKQVENNWSYGTQQNIGMRVLERIKLCLPPIEEQNSIVSYLERTIPSVNQLIEKKDTIIANMEFYKRSLIYEYVTGKKEVPA